MFQFMLFPFGSEIKRKLCVLLRRILASKLLHCFSCCFFKPFCHNVPVAECLRPFPAKQDRVIQPLCRLVRIELCQHLRPIEPLILFFVLHVNHFPWRRKAPWRLHRQTISGRYEIFRQALTWLEQTLILCCCSTRYISFLSLFFVLFWCRCFPPEFFELSGILILPADTLQILRIIYTQCYILQTFNAGAENLRHYQNNNKTLMLTQIFHAHHLFHEFPKLLDKYSCPCAEFSSTECFCCGEMNQPLRSSRRSYRRIKAWHSIFLPLAAQNVFTPKPKSSLSLSARRILQNSNWKALYPYQPDTYCKILK